MKLIVTIASEGAVAYHDVTKTVFDAVTSCYPHLKVEVRVDTRWQRCLLKDIPVHNGVYPRHETREEFIETARSIQETHKEDFE